MTAVAAGADMQLDGLIELGLCILLYLSDGFRSIEKLQLVIALYDLFILFSSLHLTVLLLVVYNNDAHTSCGTGDHAGGSLNTCSVKIRHLKLGDLLYFRSLQCGDFGLVRST